jgi:TerB N-terminal domain/TerB-C domain
LRSRILLLTPERGAPFGAVTWQIVHLLITDFESVRAVKTKNPTAGSLSMPLAPSSSYDFTLTPESREGQIHYRMEYIRELEPIGSPMLWVPPGEACQIHGVTIRHGMIFVGTGSAQDEPSLVNPALPVRRCDTYAGDAFSCCPTYAGLSPSARYHYLLWLADGARAPIDIGYVFLYFFGLERRLLLDHVVEGSEASALLAEIDRLTAVFGGGNHSFEFYARGLLNYVQLRDHAEEVPEDVSEIDDTPGYELPILFRFGLGRFVRDQREIPVDWALRWALTDRLIRRRIPVDRCGDLFEQAFTRLYRGTESMMLFHLSAIYTPFTFSYSGASPVLRPSKFRLVWEDIPDPTAIERPRQYLQSLVDEATSWIDSYSRFLGKNPDKANTLEADLKLPLFLWPQSMREQLDEVRASLATPMKPIPLSDLLARLEGSEPSSPQMVVELAKSLRKVRVGMEPDVLAGARAPRANDNVVLFELQFEGELGQRTAQFEASSLFVSLASGLAMVGGVPFSAKVEAIEKKIATWTHFTPDQQMRLRAKYRLGCCQPFSLMSLKAKLGELSMEQRLEVGVALSDLARTHGVSPVEVKFLERLYRVLKLDSQLVYSHLHGSHGERTQIDRQFGSATKSSNILLDPERIGLLERETALVSALLGDVFGEEESDLTLAVQPATSVLDVVDSDNSHRAAPPLLAGLSPSLNDFLVLILTRSEWSRAELEVAAQKTQIMLDGAMESINEEALNSFGTALLEGNDPIYIETELMEATV